MAFQLSPGVNVSEIDLTTVVPSVATSDGAIAGVFRWGPIGQRILIDSENLLAARFGKPTNLNAETWFSAANFLSYANRLYVSRAANTTGATPSVVANTVANTTVSNNLFRTAGNQTANVANGMYVLYSQNTSVIGFGTSITVANVAYDSGSNTTSFRIGSGATVNTEVTLTFGQPGTAYSSMAFPAGAVVSNVVNQIVKNSEDYDTIDGSFDSDVVYVAKYPGALGNSLKIAICDNAVSYNSNVAISNADIGNTTGQFTTSIGNTVGTFSFLPGTGGSVTNATSLATTVKNSFTIGDQIKVGNSSIGTQYLMVKSVGEVTSNATAAALEVTFEDPYRLHTAYSTASTVERYWEFFNVVDTAPGQSGYVGTYGNTSAQDELHVVVVDEAGGFTGTPGTILEVYRGLSRATDAKNADNSVNYYKEVINQSSGYIWWANDRANAVSANAALVASSTATAPGNFSMILGSDGYDESNNSVFAVVAGAYDLFVSPEDIDISLVLQGKPIGGSTSINGYTVENFQLANYIIDNIVEVRRDCVALISPDRDIVIVNSGDQAAHLTAWRGAIRSTSYAVLDSGYKYQYDRYSDLNRWIPLNGDIAGLCVRTDNTNDAWWSPAGFNRGQIKNIIKLAYNPRKSERDVLYSNGINPVVTFPGQGTVLYGDKTLQAKPSAFDRINVRRLFIVLEKAISTAAKFSLFEFNDAFTRAQFKNLVTPYLRNIQGRRGITDFLVVCDDTNNTPQVIDSNQFVGDIYIKPARSINFIQLNFVAVGTGVQFSEVVGRF
jgi:hypothetical protein